MPTPSEQVSMIREHILDTSATSPRYPNASIVMRLNAARNHIARRALCVPQIALVNTLTSTRTYTIPSNFIKARLVLFYQSAITDSPDILTERPLREIEWNSSTTTGTPSHYETWQDSGTRQIRLDSTPSTAVVSGLKIFYYATPTAIALYNDPSPTVDIPEKYHEAVIFRTASILLTVDEEPGKSIAMNQLFEAEIQRIASEEERASVVDGAIIQDTYNSITGNNWNA